VAGVRRVIVGVIGALLVVLGVILLFIPGPGLLLLAAGVGLLSLEFDWAKKLFRRTRGRADGGKGGGGGGEV
jgi:uncharacterized protein (TIGR02611 family)